MVGRPSLAELVGAEPLLGGCYRVVRQLGRGGMSTVYAVVDVASGRRLALKQLHRAASESASVLFEREYRTLAGLRHPCIVEVYDYHADRDGPFYTMELLEGSDLGSVAPLPWREACACLRDAASIVGLLHARSLVHRDLSPKNLWRTPNGRIKLLDFGALAPFGPASHVLGTPPFVAPEAVQGAPLDQRADLFALGALGYWLITASHAFPARALLDLPEVHKQTPPPASTRLTIDVIDPMPPELDALLSSLLRIDPGERIASTSALIDSLNAIAELEPENADVVQGYIESKVFVGRSRELARVSNLLHAVSEGGTVSLIIEGVAGSGRSRLLQELLVLARIAGARALSAGADSATRPYGVANALALALVNALPVAAQRCAEPYAATLGHLSPELRARLDVLEPAVLTKAPREARSLIQGALCAWFLSVARDQLIAVCVDDLHAVDEESQAFLAALAHAAGDHKLFVAATLEESEVDRLSPALHSFREGALRIALGPLEANETRQLLQSVFGNAPYLERLAERLHRVCEGHPAYCLELAEHLIRTGTAHYAEGVWQLPVELSAEQLPKSRKAGITARLSRVSLKARALAQLLSVPNQGHWSRAACLGVAEPPAGRAEQWLAELLREGVLIENDAGLRFAHETLRETLYAELSESRRVRAHRLFAELALAHGPNDRVTLLRASVHRLRAGDLRRGRRLLKRALAQYAEGEGATLAVAAPLVEQALGLLVARGEPPHALLMPYAILSFAGYLVDRRYALRYGDDAIAVFERVFHLRMARTLTRVVGKHLTLLVVLLLAGTGLALRRSFAPSLRIAIRFLLTATSSLAGTAAVFINPKGAARYARTIEPFTALGKDHVAQFLHAFCQLLVRQNGDSRARVLADQRAMIARLESDRPIRELPREMRLQYLAGVYFAAGVNESRRDGPETLRIAERLERFSPLYAMSADYLRSSFYGHQGDFARAEQYRRRMETHAIQLGSAWQAETWAPLDAANLARRTEDAPLLKRAVRELSRLAAEIPSLALQEQRTRGLYQLLRGKPREAALLLDGGDPPLAVIGWTYTRAALARAYNAMNDHTHARAVCRDALARLTPEDLTFTATNLDIQVELALAEAGLGRLTLAAEQLDQLIARHAPQRGVLTLGGLHAARTEVALLADDRTACQTHLDAAAGWYLPTMNPALIEIVTRLRRRVSQHFRVPTDEERERENDTMVRRRITSLLTGSGDQVERAAHGLSVALELTRAAGGFMLLSGRDPPVLAPGTAILDLDLLHWARTRLAATAHDVATERMDSASSAEDENRKTFVGLSHRFMPLWSRHTGCEMLVGALVLGVAPGEHLRIDASLIAVVARYLADDPMLTSRSP